MKRPSERWPNSYTRATRRLPSRLRPSKRGASATIITSSNSFMLRRSTLSTRRCYSTREPPSRCCGRRGCLETRGSPSSLSHISTLHSSVSVAVPCLRMGYVSLLAMILQWRQTSGVAFAVCMLPRCSRGFQSKWPHAGCAAGLTLRSRCLQKKFTSCETLSISRPRH